MAPCSCGKPECIQCFIQSTATMYIPPPHLEGPPIEALVLVVRPIPTSDPGEFKDRQESLSDICHVLQALTLVFPSLSLTASLQTKKSIR